MRNRILAISLLAAASAVACGRPKLEGFHAGGFTGTQCPPASEPDGTCDIPDCGVDCVANTPCDPAQATCPVGTTCDTSLGDPYCMPKLCSFTSPECPSGEYCVSDRYSKGICVPVDPTPTPCPGLDCAFPFWCVDGFCKLPCDRSECPTGTACVDDFCEPGG